MNFIADKQTLEDLNLLGKYKSNSIYNLFNHTKTKGGEKLLETIFSFPLTDDKQINARSAIFQYFQSQKFIFPFDRESVEIAEFYLSEGKVAGLISSALSTVQKKILKVAIRSEDYGHLEKGIVAVLNLLFDFQKFFEQFKGSGDHPLQNRLNEVSTILKKKSMLSLLSEKKERELTTVEIIRYENLLRNLLLDDLHAIFAILYELDLYISVSDVARNAKMGYAFALPASENRLKAVDLRHPALQNATANNIALDQYKNVLFLTGANMAGKSTLMKTIGASMYLAHLGMPVAAEQFEFSIRDGIYSSINVPDDLNMGYSHFYAEVLRVKTVAEKVSVKKNLLVLFDELFKGTNVKDAYDATLEVSQAFANYTNCLFVISTHIIEVGDALGKRCGNILFQYLPTVMEGTVPKYTYRLKDGITSDRQGMLIIENERILEIIKGEVTVE